MTSTTTPLQQQHRRRRRLLFTCFLAAITAMGVTTLLSATISDEESEYARRTTFRLRFLQQQQQQDPSPPLAGYTIGHSGFRRDPTPAAPVRNTLFNKEKFSDPAPYTMVHRGGFNRKEDDPITGPLKFPAVKDLSTFLRPTQQQQPQNQQQQGERRDPDVKRSDEKLNLIANPDLASAPVEYRTVHLGNGGTGIDDPEMQTSHIAPDNEAHGVRCCSDGVAWEAAGDGNHRQYPGWSMKSTGCPYSYDLDEDTECNLVSYQQARDFCAYKGGRLCTARELVGRCAVGTGCMFDLEYVWTSQDEDGGEGGIDLRDGGEDAASADASSVEAMDETADALATQASFAAEADYEIRGNDGGPPPLIHVFSPYHDHSAETFSPLNEDQWVMLVSAKNARDTYNAGHSEAKRAIHQAFDRVVLVCAILEMDSEALDSILSSYCDRVVVLPRSTADVYSKLKPLPFIQDIIDAGRSVVEGDADFYLMLTNADICPTENLYQFAWERLGSGNGRSTAISINRMTVPHFELPTNNDDPVEVKNELATQIMRQARDAAKQGKWHKHPGHDCFVFHSSMLNTINLGEQFLGFPRWGGNLNFMLQFMATNYKNIKSTKFGTFHLGDERSWEPDDRHNPKGDMSFWKDFDRRELELLMYCPLADFPPQDLHTLQNVINCGKIFRPRPNGAGDAVVPAFVRPGHEDVFLENHAKYLNYSPEGLPQTRMEKLTPERRRGWINMWG
eukprot:CAMPEP_0172546046 /NCGR_PEP_ID=MMETSP1067-20121228/15871_1 /TAXON_ID=265564 ORGANISM="Thalassiosira punctigera, Strain Tpunct2005C2" /NCGR_SAMPLE_ID=MMETSP1067 /ASSEMBLY_ACC=CAM_ASM_000444 /LENGTH=730 /DNA_ID=CAMNT_0013332911 /DNA_START=31 /DNA_END=2223 /DNA_ORIENTATION=+